MDQATKFDPRVGPFTLSVKSLAHPQTVYYDKAKNVRAEHIEGVLHLYRHADITAVNRHPDVLGTGGRGGAMGNDNPLIPLEIDGPEHRKWRRVLDPMFAPKQVAMLEDGIRELARELIDDFAGASEADLTAQFCVPLPCLTFLRLVGAPVKISTSSSSSRTASSTLSETPSRRSRPTWRWRPARSTSTSSASSQIDEARRSRNLM